MNRYRAAAMECRDGSPPLYREIRGEPFGLECLKKRESDGCRGIILAGRYSERYSPGRPCFLCKHNGEGALGVV